MLITVGLLQACASFRPQFPFQVPRADRDSGSSRCAAGRCHFRRCWTIPARGAQTWVSGCSAIVEACDRCGGRVQCGDEEWRGFGEWVDGWVKRFGGVGGMKLFIVCRRCLCRTALLSLLWKPRCPKKSLAPADQRLAACITSFLAMKSCMNSCISLIPKDGIRCKYFDVTGAWEPATATSMIRLVRDSRSETCFATPSHLRSASARFAIASFQRRRHVSRACSSRPD
jgi:hypothetical protein